MRLGIFQRKLVILLCLFSITVLPGCDLGCWINPKRCSDYTKPIPNPNPPKPPEPPSNPNNPGDINIPDYKGDIKIPENANNPNSTLDGKLKIESWKVE
jgi:hypothetical protein